MTSLGSLVPSIVQSYCSCSTDSSVKLHSGLLRSSLHCGSQIQLAPQPTSRTDFTLPADSRCLVLQEPWTQQLGAKVAAVSISPHKLSTLLVLIFATCCVHHPAHLVHAKSLPLVYHCHALYGFSGLERCIRIAKMQTSGRCAILVHRSSPQKGVSVKFMSATRLQCVLEQGGGLPSRHCTTRHPTSQQRQRLH